ncbi:MAG TPA: hypothetical protein VME40_10115 [Caulobacteraceae bacterium]|nr:hypothetical protein [Caulobacteraceae bacterium]
MKRIILVALAASTLAACETGGPNVGPAPPSGPAYIPPSGGNEAFRDSDFAWSTASGSGAIDGVLAYNGPGGRYTCSDVILAPETPWSRARMRILYLSTTQAAMPVDDVKARTPPEHSTDYARYARKASCDANGDFSFTGLPNGSWYVITVATPANGTRMAVMRRVTTNGGTVRVTLR